MRLPVRFFVFPAVAAVLALAAGNPAAAQSSSAEPGQTAAAPNGPAPGNGTYVSINPLAGVRYDNRWDLSLGMAYDHMKAGPNVLQGANLGGLDLSGSMYLAKSFRVETSERAYVGTSGVGEPNTLNLKGPFVSEYFFTAGPEWLGPHNEHGAMMAHFLVGGVYGNFEKDLLGKPAAYVDFYHNQMAPAAIIGGHLDLNRSARWVFRITPDAVMTHYNFSDAPYSSQSFSQFDVNFAISVGMEYKFSKRR